eukprot:TRINITY_DN69730_c0_g1_i1.p2 TRINITY_DN69730_c0_g1~~TRINITY_DN69730_c0_g1_i1.p2  ORF type:complete len:100 (-),score=8.24 TRINITY_DN69730_c0_g1_i1:183-482(-)
MKITIANDKVLRYVIASPYDTRQIPYNRERFNTNKLYLHVDMAGRTYTIDRLTRHKKNKKYVGIAVLLVGDPVMANSDNSVFFVNIDEAVKAKEVSISN